MNQIQSGVLDKISGLLSSLSLTYKELSLVAEEMEDHNLKIALEGLSVESCMYAEELCTQLKMIGITVARPCIEEEANGANEEDVFIVHPGGEVAYICKKHEQSVSQAYTRVLSERLPCPVISQMLQLQFRAIRDAFLKLNLLNTSRFAFS